MMPRTVHFPPEPERFPDDLHDVQNPVPRPPLKAKAETNGHAPKPSKKSGQTPAESIRIAPLPNVPTENPGYTTAELREDLLNRADELFEEALTLDGKHLDLRLFMLLRKQPLVKEWIDEVRIWRTQRSRLKIRECCE